MKQLAIGLACAAVILCCAMLPPGALVNVRLAWNASSSPVGITGYNVYWGPASGNYTNSLTVATNGCCVSNLSRGGTYWFAVTAVDGLGYESVPSTETNWSLARPGGFRVDAQ